jgi:hypothetical protein
MPSEFENTKPKVVIISEEEGLYEARCFISLSLLSLTLYQCCGSGVFIPDPGFFPSRI